MKLNSEEYKIQLRGLAIVPNYSSKLEKEVMKSIDNYSETEMDKVYFKHAFYRCKVDYERGK